MIMISGIDGVLCPSIFASDGNQDRHSSEFQKQLLAVLAFPWVTEAVCSVFRTARIVIFISGRGVYLNDITTTWVRERLGIHSFYIVNAGLTTEDRDPDAKIASFDKAICQCVRARKAPHEQIHVLEDDPVNLDKLLEMARDLADVVVYEVRDGKGCIVCP